MTIMVIMIAMIKRRAIYSHTWRSKGTQLKFMGQVISTLARMHSNRLRQKKLQLLSMTTITGYFCYYYLAIMVNSMSRTPLTLFKESVVLAAFHMLNLIINSH